jgi:hypothetical protein
MERMQLYPEMDAGVQNSTPPKVVDPQDPASPSHMDPALFSGRKKPLTRVSKKTFFWSGCGLAFVHRFVERMCL